MIFITMTHRSFWVSEDFCGRVELFGRGGCLSLAHAPMLAILRCLAKVASNFFFHHTCKAPGFNTFRPGCATCSYML